MMQLICNGVSLDLYEDAGLQMVKNNPIFAFDELSAERTTSFNIPSTPKNDRVFQLARIPAYKGMPMRRTLDTILQDGVFVTRGFLHISRYSGTEYEAVFVFGKLFDLKSLRWGDLQGLDAIGSPINANTSPMPMIARVKYHTDKGQSPAPSISIAQILDELNTQNILRISGIDLDVETRFIPKLWTIGYEDVKIQISSEPDGNGGLTVGTSDDRIIGEDTRGIVIEIDPQTEAATRRLYNPFDNGLYRAEGVDYITFPEDTPANVCLCYVDDYDQIGQGKIGFIGTRKYVGGGVFDGEPLAGQKVYVGDHSLFVLLSVFENSAGQPIQDLVFTDIDYDRESSIYLSIRVENRNSDLGWSALKNVSVGDLLKAYSALTGKLIGTDASGAIRFVDSINPTYIEPKITKRVGVSRTFSDWAKENFVRFKEEEGIPNDMVKTISYTIDNDNIEETKDILVLEASQGLDFGDGTLLVNEQKEDGNLSEELPNANLGDPSDGEYMNLVGDLQKSTILQDIVSSSTMLEIECHMNLYEYMQVYSETGFVVDNTKYTWVTGQWQNDTAKFTLAKM